MNSFDIMVQDDNNNNGKRFRFDTGPSLLLLPDVYKDTFASLGERLEDHIDLIEVNPLYR